MIPKFHIRHNHDNQVVSIALNRNEIVYDLHFATNRIARLKFVDDEGNILKQGHDAETNDERNTDYIDRLIVSAIANIRSHTTFASCPENKVTTDDIFDSECQWFIHFSLPKDWRGSAHSLCSFLHDYVVNACATKWLMLTNATQAQFFNAEADANLDRAVYELRKQYKDDAVLYHLTY